MAFVLIQHLEAEHESMPTELLSKVTEMPVTEVRKATPVEPNHVYVIPANADLSLADGAIRVSARKAVAGRHLPIDHFFRTLAEAQEHLAIGVVLSGTASDGTLGLKAIKAAGGITFAQEPKSAKFDGMPKSALLAGCVDFVLNSGAHRQGTVAAHIPSQHRALGPGKSGAARSGMGRGLEAHLQATPGRLGSGLHVLQETHDQAARRPPHGLEEVGAAERVFEGPPEQPRYEQMHIVHFSARYSLGRMPVVRASANNT